MTLRATLIFFLSLTTLASDLSHIHELLKTDIAKAENELKQALKQDGQQAEAELLLTQLYNKQGELGKALDHGKQAVKLAPESGAAHYAYAVALRNKLQDSTLFAMTNTGTYKDHLNKAIELDPEDSEPFLERIGFLLNAPGIVGGSEKKANEMVTLAHEKSKVLGLRAELMIAEHFEKADDQLRLTQQLVELDPQTEVHYVRYGIQLTNRERYADAIAFYEQTLKDHPSFLAVQYQLGRARYIAEDDFAKALQAFTSYIDQFPPLWVRPKYFVDLSYAYWRRGLVHQKQDNKTAAKADFQKAIQLDPDNEDAKKALKKL